MIAEIVSQHTEVAAFLWLVRSNATRQPYYTLKIWPSSMDGKNERSRGESLFEHVASAWCADHGRLASASLAHRQATPTYRRRHRTGHAPTRPAHKVVLYVQLVCDNLLS